MKGKRKKGQYGYRGYHRKTETAKVLFGAAMILVQLGARNFTDMEAAKNILTVMAILSVLPTANAASPLIAAWNCRTTSQSFYEKAKACEDKGILLYDLIITSKEQILPMDAVMIHQTGVFAYCTSQKADQKKAEDFLNEMFRTHQLEAKVNVIKDEAAFLKRINSLKPSGSWTAGTSADAESRLLKNLSM